ncbi:hypothetical protein [Cohnella sp. WQ 127256]|uniref:hypothetical protein n=1 Tax=Cohnella sp. WQ 127256 TaxID=2938790 RepID=UPI002117C86A|nr:hypothetical protein [Cohnella sp. WQ 127256]
MSSRAINTILNLRDRFSEGIRRAAGNTENLRRSVQQTNNQVRSFGSTAATGFGNVAKSVAGLVVAYAGFQQVSSFLNDSVAEAKVMIEQETKLQAIMKNTKGVTDAQVRSILDYASAQEELGVIGGDVQIAGAQQIATFQLQASTIKKLMPAMNDLLAQSKGINATTQDGVGVGNLFGKVMNGQVGALSKLGINFTKAQEKVLKFGTESEKAATLAEVLKMNVGGVNAALAQTDEGKIKQAGDVLGGMKEEIGRVVIKLKADFAGFFVRYLPRIQKIVMSTFDGIKKGINFALPYLKSMGNVALNIFSSVRQWGTSAFEKIKQKIAENQPTIDSVKGVLSDLGDKAIALKDYLIDAFNGGVPFITWIKDEGIPALVDGIAEVVDIATGLYDYIKKNWTTFEPIIYGIVGAITAYKVATIAVTTATRIWNGITKTLAITQGILNAVMNMSPIGWIATAIGLLVMAGVALYQNWDTVVEKAKGLWKWISDIWINIKDATVGAFNGMGDIIRNTFDSVVGFIKKPINAVIDMINNLIDHINNISFDVPDWVPDWAGGGSTIGVSISKIPNFSTGTDYFKGGLARINERGSGEIVDLPNGSRVIPADKSARMIDNLGKNNGINVYLTIQGNVYGNDDFAKQVGSYIADRIQLNLSNA